MSRSRVANAAAGRWWVVPALGALLALTAWAYWPGLDGPLLLDDTVNLRVLDSLQDNPDYSADVISGNTSGPGGRPISMYSFVLERLWLGEDAAIAKRSNLFLHLFNGLLVYLLARVLLGAARQRPARLMALLVSAFWLSSPLLLSTVLYVIQRMAMLSAMFSLLSLLFFCLARLSNGGLAWRLLLAMLSLASLVCGVLSKENAVLTVPLMLAIEVYILQFRGAPPGLKNVLTRASRWLPALCLLAGIWLLVFTPEYVSQGYGHRDFTLAERLLTQCRVVWHYVAQLLWVDVHTLGVYHDDVVISSGLTEPGSTLWAVAGWLGALSLCGYSLIAGRLRLLAFGVAFYLLAHALESTVIALEIYFEHRNYLPAFGLFFALVAVAGQLAGRWRWLGGWLLMGALVLLLRSLLLLGSQAVLWSDAWLIHLEAVNYHPRSERALLETALLYARLGELDGALDYAGRAADVGDRGPLSRGLQAAVIRCMVNAPLPDDMLQGIDQADAELGTAAPADAMYVLNRKMAAGDCPRTDGAVFADRMLVILNPAGKSLANPKLLATMVLFENNLGRLPESMLYVEALLRREPENVLGLQFKLYLAGALEDAQARDEALAGLRSLRDQGRLNVQEQYNLSLFDEDGAQQ